jgi:hypothetical protein
MENKIGKSYCAYGGQGKCTIWLGNLGEKSDFEDFVLDGMDIKSGSQIK